jgi:hypothetical protein
MATAQTTGGNIWKDVQGLSDKRLGWGEGGEFRVL